MKRLDKTLGDYVAIAISPVLIMLMVGSLLHFLVAVCYRGQFDVRIHWILSCFTVAIVLIARISIEEGQERATLFGAALAGAIGLAMMRFSDALFVPWILLGVTWWAAHKLTWDCTLIDETQDASGRGLLQIVKLRRKKRATPSVKSPHLGPPPEGEGRKDAPVELEGVTSREEAIAEWKSGWGQWIRARLEGRAPSRPAPPLLPGRAAAQPSGSPGEAKKKARPHAPGVWILYFSLAALPLFGLGQLLIPRADVARRQWAFLLLCVYVASGLALLVTTSFLGLRRYLRQRGIEMPTDVAGVWIALGAGIIVVLLFVAALLPRPAAEYPISRFPVQITFTTPPRETSPMAVGNDGPTQDEQARRQRIEEDTRRSAPSQSGEPDRSQAKGDSDRRDADGTSDRQAKDDKTSELGRDKRQRDQDRSGADQKSESRDNASDKPREQTSDARRDSDRENRDDAARRQGGDKREETASSRRAKPSAGRSASRASAKPRPPSQWLRLPQISVSLGGFFKLVFYVLFFGLVGYWLWKSRERVLAAIRQLLDELRDFWARLFGSRKRAGESVEEDTATQPQHRPFSEYVDPFASGLTRQYSAQQLVRYTFEALEAWARENDCAREPDQTPREFARRVATRETSLAEGVKTLAGLYSRVAYASGRPSAKAIEPLAEFWRRMRATAAKRTQPAEPTQHAS